MRPVKLLLLPALLLVAGLAHPQRKGESDNFPFNNTTAVGAEAFLKAHPTYDGRGVVIGILDNGVHLGIPGLTLTSDGKPKIIDARDFTGEGDLPLNEAKVVKENEQEFLALGKQRWRGHGSLAHKPAGPYYLAIFEESRLLNNSEVKDINQNGKALADCWAFLVFKTTEEFWVAYPDTDMDNDFAGEPALRDYAVRRDTFQFGPRNPDKQKTVMLCCVTIRPEDKVLEVYYPTGSHGTHVAGMAAGHHMNNNPHHNGIAPGAQILALKLGHCGMAGGSTTTGAMLKAYEYAVQWSKKNPDQPLVLNMSYGIGSEIEGHAVMEKMLDKIFGDNPQILCSTSNGNEGPGISSTGLPAASKRVWSAGAMMAADTLATVWGADIKTFKPFIFTSRGGEVPKPDGIAPGGAAATVPRYLTRDAMWGTSMASPQTAGFMACVASACAQEKIPYTNMVFYRAMHAAALPLEGWNELDQGSGLIQMGKTFEYLKLLAARGEHEQLYAYDIQAEAPNMPRGVGQAAYFRTGDTYPAYPETTTFTVKPVLPAGLKPDQRNEFYRAYDFVASQPWIRLNKPAAYIRGELPLQLSVWYDPTALAAPGLYVGTILAYRKDLPREPQNIEFRLLNTVVVPHRLSAENRFNLEFRERQIGPGDIQRYYVNVPAGIQALTARLTSPEGKFCRALTAIFSPDGHEVAGWSAKTDTTPTPSYNSVIGRKLFPGVWEIVVWGFYQNREVSHFNLQIQGTGLTSEPKIIESFSYTHPKPPKGELTVTNLVNRNLEGSASGEVLGYTRTWTRELKTDNWAHPFQFPAGVKAVRFELKLSREDYNLFTDFAVEIRDGKGKALQQKGFSTAEVALEMGNPGGEATYHLTLVPGFAAKSPQAFQIEVREDYLTEKTIPIQVGGVKLAPYVPTTLTFTLGGVPAPVPQGFQSLGQILFRDGAENQLRGFVPVRFDVELPRPR